MKIETTIKAKHLFDELSDAVRAQLHLENDTVYVRLPYYVPGQIRERAEGIGRAKTLDVCNGELRARIIEVRRDLDIIGFPELAGGIRVPCRLQLVHERNVYLGENIVAASTDIEFSGQLRLNRNARGGAERFERSVLFAHRAELGRVWQLRRSHKESFSRTKIRRTI